MDTLLDLSGLAINGSWNGIGHDRSQAGRWRTDRIRRHAAIHGRHGAPLRRRVLRPPAPVLHPKVLPMKKLLRVLGAAMALTLAQASATAQTYPARPITLIVPHGAGGANDAVGRAFAHKLGTQVDQSVVVDNRPGA